ncbi:gcrA cell cycle regulator family protein [Vibrio toranzoniae]|uniref:gcrA cell cycle regulator family protein n=1 Tax=Vibrio toranzoniae TaxID=1194427 RepID=UPI001378B817|nr:gcrA cell cycle regulator family protein [Vibrio toranzoniae]NAZ72042.1 gcrA cell cycle regulator family protein [Vibrio toranzoniae]
MDSSFLSQDVNTDCSFSDLLVRLPKVSDRSLRDEEEQLSVKSKPKRWTSDELEQLTNQFHQGNKLASIASFFNCSTSSVEYQLRKLKLKRFKKLSLEDAEYLKQNYWLFDVEFFAKKLNRSVSSVRYFIDKLELKRPKLDSAQPPIPRRLMPYDMVKRVSILERNCSDSTTRVDDSVVIFYDKTGPSTPMMAMHLDELCLALDKHFNRRNGVTAAALTHGYKASSV